MLYSQVIAERAEGVTWTKPPTLLTKEQNIFDYIFKEKGTFYPSALAVKASIAQNSPFDESISFGDDDQFAADIWRKGSIIESIKTPLTLYDDKEGLDKLSQSATKAQAQRVSKKRYLDWVESKRLEIPEPAYLAYRATVYSTYIVQLSKWQAAKEIWRAKQAGVFSLKQVIRQSVQTFTPRLYRKLSDYVASKTG